jgi:hypothetical protein
MQLDALVDGFRVRREQSQVAVLAAQAQLPDLVAALVMAEQEAEVGPGMGDGAIAGVGVELGFSARPLETVSPGVAVEIGSENKAASRVG